MNNRQSWLRHLSSLRLLTGVFLALFLSFSGMASAFTLGTPTATTVGPVVNINSPQNGTVLTSTKIDVIGTAASVGGSQGIDMVIVVDDSGSLSTSDPTNVRFAALQTLLNNISTGSDIKLGLVFFASTAKLDVPLDTASNATKAINTAIAAHTYPNGGTATDQGIKTAVAELSTNGRPNASKVILLFTDGYPNSDSLAIAEATSAKAAGITINVVQLGTSAGSNQQVASAGGGQVLAATSPQGLAALFSSAKIVNISSVSVTNTTTGVAASNLVLGAGGFSASVNLIAGQNVISVSATDTSGLTATQTVTVTQQQSTPAATLTLSSLLVSGASSLKAGDSTSYSATAVYSDGSTKTVTPAWSATGSGASITSSGTMTAVSSITVDSPVTITAIYTEGSATKTANFAVMVNAPTTPTTPATPTTPTATSGCSGTAPNTGAITIVGTSVKQLGEPLDVKYCLKGFNKATYFDVYVAVQIPTGEMLFLSSSGSFFGTPTFAMYDGKNKPAAYLAGTLVPDLDGSVLTMSVTPMNLPTGTYTFYAIPVLKGADVMNGFNWVGSLAQGKVTLTK